MSATESRGFRGSRVFKGSRGTRATRAGRATRASHNHVYLAVIESLAIVNGDRRFQPQVNSTKSWVTERGERGFLYSELQQGKEGESVWSFVLPTGPRQPIVYGWGRILETEPGWISYIWQIEDNLAGLRPSRKNKAGWSWEQHTDEITGWGRVCGHGAKAPLKATIPPLPRVEEFDGYNVWSRRRKLAGEAIKIAGAFERKDFGKSNPRSGWHHVGLLDLRANKAIKDIIGGFEPSPKTGGKGVLKNQSGSTGTNVKLGPHKVGCIDTLSFVPVKINNYTGEKRRRKTSRNKTEIISKTPPYPPSLFGKHKQRRSLSALLKKRILESARSTREKSAGFSSREEWNKNAADIRKALKKSLDFPEPRTSAPEVRVVGSEQGDGFTVDKIFIEGLPGIWGSALLYKPVSPPPSNGYPALLHILGHYGKGKHRPSARILGATMASHGWMVLTVDCLSLGERKTPKGRTIENHHFMGFWNVMAGTSPGRIIYGETRRFLEALLYHPSVNKEKLAVTGSSGGGTATIYLAGLDERVKAAAVVAAVSTWEHFGGFIGGDPEQYPQNLIRIADFSTLLSAIAPRPLLVAGGKKDDLFPAHEGRKSVERASKIYSLLGAKENILFFGDSGPHGYQAPRRQAVYDFLRRKLTPGKERIVDSPKKALPPKKLRTGGPPDTRTLADCARDHRKKLRAFYSEKMGDKDFQRNKIRENLGWKKSPPFIGEIKTNGLITGSGGEVTVKIAPHQNLPAHLHVPGGVITGGVVYITDTGRAASFLTADLLARGVAVLEVDLSGRGALTPTRRSRYGLRRGFKNIDKAIYIEEFFPAAYTLATGENLWGLRQGELKGVVHALTEFGGFDTVGVIGQGTESSVYALAAGALDNKVGAVMGVDGLPTINQLLKISEFPPSGLVAPNALIFMDIPDLISLNDEKPVMWSTSGKYRTSKQSDESEDRRKKLHRWLNRWIVEK